MFNFLYTKSHTHVLFRFWSTTYIFILCPNSIEILLIKKNRSLSKSAMVITKLSSTKEHEKLDKKKCDYDVATDVLKLLSNIESHMK